MKFDKLQLKMSKISVNTPKQVEIKIDNEFIGLLNDAM